MKLSARGERFIANEEGVRKNKQGLHIPYLCAAGKWTLGYGEVVGEEGVVINFNGVIPKATTPQLGFNIYYTEE